MSRGASIDVNVPRGETFTSLGARSAKRERMRGGLTSHSEINPPQIDGNVTLPRHARRSATLTAIVAADVARRDARRGGATLP